MIIDLSRFLNKENGPITSLVTSPVRTKGQTFYYSTALLNGSFLRGFRSFDILTFGGGGWSTNKRSAQEKAITEAIERWAFILARNNNQIDLGIMDDPTSNGFSALPKEYPIQFAYIHSLNECIERYFLSLFADNILFKLKPITSLIAENFLFSRDDGDLMTFGIEVLLKENFQNFLPKVVKTHFVLSLFLTRHGGVIPGSACNINSRKAQIKAVEECFVNFISSEKIRELDIHNQASITEKRLKNYSKNSELTNRIKNRVFSCLESKEFPEVPEIKLVKEFPGPWCPEINIVRVLLKDIPPITSGDELRFII